MMMTPKKTINCQSIGSVLTTTPRYMRSVVQEAGIYDMDK